LAGTTQTLLLLLLVLLPISAFDHAQYAPPSLPLYRFKFSSPLRPRIYKKLILTPPGAVFKTINKKTIQSAEDLRLKAARRPSNVADGKHLASRVL